MRPLARFEVGPGDAPAKVAGPLLGSRERIGGGLALEHDAVAQEVVSDCVRLSTQGPVRGKRIKLKLAEIVVAAAGPAGLVVDDSGPARPDFDAVDNAADVEPAYLCPEALLKQVAVADRGAVFAPEASKDLQPAGSEIGRVGGNQESVTALEAFLEAVAQPLPRGCPIASPTEQVFEDLVNERPEERPCAERRAMPFNVSEIVRVRAMLVAGKL